MVKYIFIIITIIYLFIIYYKLFIFNKNKNIDLVIARYNENLNWLNNLDLSLFRKIIIYNKGNNINCLESKKIYHQDYILNKKISNLSINVNYISNLTIVNLPNVGRCDHTYLYHIIHNYYNLSNVTIFLPGSCDLPYKWKITQNIIKQTIKNNDSTLKQNITEDIRKVYRDFELDNWHSTDHRNFSMNNEEYLLKCHERPFINWYNKNFSDVGLVIHTVYHGIFSVSKKDIHKRSLESYKNLIKYLDHHSNPEAGHYFERAWSAVFYNDNKL